MDPLHTKPLAAITNDTYRRPYLNLAERLSQVWFNYYTLFTLLLLLKIVLFRRSLQASLSEAETETYSLCESAEKYASELGSIPHHASRYMNVLLVKAMQEANNGLVESLSLMLTGAKNLIIFAINMVIGTYTCLLTGAADISANVALNTTEKVIDLANTTITHFAHDLNNGLSEVSTAANRVIGTIEDTASTIQELFTGSDSHDTSDLSSRISNINLTISSLSNWSIPSSVDSDIESLRSKVPDFEDVQNRTNELISTPFNLLQWNIRRADVNVFSARDMYVPQMQNITFCRNSNEIDEFYRKAGKLTYKMSTILVCLLVAAMAALVAHQAWCVWRNWKRMNEAAVKLQAFREAVPDKSVLEYNLGVIDSFQNRASALVAGLVAKPFSKKDVDDYREISGNRVRWLVNYSISPFALPVLLLGLTGIVAYVFQTVILNTLSNLDTSDLRDFAGKALNTVSLNLNQSVEDWCTHTNDYIQDYQDELNESMLGWVENATSSVNNTVTQFSTQMNSKIRQAFGGTIMYDVVSTVVGCVIGNKLAEVERAMTWVHNKANVTLPMLNSTELLTEVYGGGNSHSDSNGEVRQRLGEIEDELKRMIAQIIRQYRKALRTELVISLALIGFWVGIVMMGGAILGIQEWRIHAKNKEFDGGLDFTPIDKLPTIINSDPLDGETARDKSGKFFKGKGVINETLSGILERMTSVRKSHNSTSSTTTHKAVYDSDPTFSHKGGSQDSFYKAFKSQGYI